MQEKEVGSWKMSESSCEVVVVCKVARLLFPGQLCLLLCACACEFVVPYDDKNLVVFDSVDSKPLRHVMSLQTIPCTKLFMEWQGYPIEKNILIAR